MALFLKQTKIKNRVFLQISETTYNSETKMSSNRCYKKLGFLDELKNNKVKDPVSFYKNEIKKLNDKRKKQINETKKIKITNRKEKRVGYFLAKTILDSLNLKSKFKEFCSKTNCSDEYFAITEDLIFSKMVTIFSSNKSVKNSLSFVFNSKQYNDEQIYNTLEFLGNHYQEVVNILVTQIIEKFQMDCKMVFFDSFKSIYEINSNEHCFNFDILMDENVIPIGLIINTNSLKKLGLSSNGLKTFETMYKPEKIIRVADKGINYSNNLYNAIINKNGYIFPLSLTMLIDNDKEWILNKNDYENIYKPNGELYYKAKEEIKEYFVKLIKNDGELVLLKTKQKRVATFDENLYAKKKENIYQLVDQAKTLFYSNAQKNDYSKALKYLTILKEEGKQDKIKINQNKIDNELRYAGFKMIVTSEEYLTKENLFYISDSVWKIESCFRFLKNHVSNEQEIMKSPNRIIGSSLISFFVVTLLRIIDVKVFKRKFPFDEIIDFIKNLKFYEIGNIYINLLTPSSIVTYVEELFNISLSNVYFKKSEINNLLKVKYKL